MRIQVRCVLLALAALPVAIPAQAVVHTFLGTAAGGNLGNAVAAAGDVDGDGFDDVVLGAPSLGPGSAQVRSGRTGAVLWTFTGAQLLDRFGQAVGGAGDVNGDGFDDVVVGAPGAFIFATAPGYVRVFSGATGAQLHAWTGPSTGDQFGPAVGGAGDVDDDGYDDVVVGVPTLGAARVYSGRTGAVLHAWTGLSPGDWFGSAVAGGGDIDGDGYPDLVVGAPNHNGTGIESGAARVFSGRTGGVLHTFVGASATDRLGAAVAIAGDLDNDGRADVVVGAPRDDGNGGETGSVRTYSGRTGSPLWTRFGGSYDAFGTSVAAAGDVDGDSRADVVVGAPQPPLIAPTLPGYARVFSGTGATLFTVQGAAVDDRAGTSVAGAGDVDGDGRAEVVVGAPGNDQGAGNGGMARVHRTLSAIDPGRRVDYGAGCPGADGRLPRIVTARRPILGATWDCGVRAAPLSRPAALRLAFGRASVPLASIGMPGCTLLTQLFVDFAVPTNAAGRAGGTLPVPNDLSLVGLKVNLQWWILAPAANALGVNGSDAAEVTVGRG